ncbi:DUF982 domain-containing protein [Mesorhizobium sp. M1396]|uniref:DUF982 domain-containing protein n=1 Tax=Mesorhizobium sp. M1396 TaxID=2957095 RepID=UPI003337F2CE
MIAGRLRECLKILRWEAGDLAAELGRPQSEVASWLDGRNPSPLAVVAWLEALVKAHRALPAPGRCVPSLDAANVGPAKIELTGSSLPGPNWAAIRARSAAPKRLFNPRYKTSSPIHPIPGGPRSSVFGPPQVLHNREEAQAMNRGQFEEPVTLLVGMGFPRKIDSVMEAYALLQDWPTASRNGAHAVALNACKAGIAGEIDPETVRATLVTFARRNEILVPDMVSPPAAVANGALHEVR